MKVWAQGSKLAYVTLWVDLDTHQTHKYTTFSLEMDQKGVVFFTCSSVTHVPMLLCNHVERLNDAPTVMTSENVKDISF